MIGRQKEKEMLLNAYNSDYSEFVVVYGRRRVGKTFLVRETFNYHFTFQHTGVAKAKMREQLMYFRDSLADAGLSNCPVLSNWHEAFRHLQKLLEAKPEGRKVVFIDELPYMATRKSDCVAAFEHFWNGWASARKDILLVVCGSAASWLLDKIIANKGGLHNRVTVQIPLSPFTLSECAAYAESKKLGYGLRQLAECYMALGGIPFYWKSLEKGLSVAQNMDRLFFAKGAPLAKEYDELYAALFDSPEPYMKIVAALGHQGGGMSRDEISTRSGIPTSGSLTRYLSDLEKCGFISRFRTYGRGVRDHIYRLMDNYTLFYFRFIAENADGDERFWSDSLGAGQHHAWLGLAFERLCLQHIGEIKHALGIAGVRTSFSSWVHKANALYPKGAQIDLLIERADDLINLCEMKYSPGRYLLDKREYELLENRRAAFVGVTGTTKGVNLTMITTEGLEQNSYSTNIQSQVTLKDLFAARRDNVSLIV